MRQGDPRGLLRLILERISDSRKHLQRETLPRKEPVPMVNIILAFLVGMTLMDILWAWKTGFLGHLIRRARS